MSKIKYKISLERDKAIDYIIDALLYWKKSGAIITDVKVYNEDGTSHSLTPYTISKIQEQPVNLSRDLLMKISEDTVAIEATAEELV